MLIQQIHLQAYLPIVVGDREKSFPGQEQVVIQSQGIQILEFILVTQW